MSANVPCATDVGVSGDNVQVLPCCQVWRKKYTKAEKGRNLLRQGVDLLQTKLDQLYNENVNLKKANEKGQKDGKEIELATRESLEKETFALKCEISALKQREVAGAQERNEEIEVLQARVFDRDKEIGRLKELLEKEKIRADSEKKKAAVERKKAAEALKRLESDEGKADKERNKVEDYKLQLEVLNNEFQKANSNFITEMSKFDEARRELEAERLKSTEERKRADLQMLKAEEHRRLAEANMKKVESLSKQLEDARTRIEELNKERHVLSLPIVSPEVFSDQQHAKRIQPEPTNGKKQADPEMKDSYEKDTSVERAKTKHLRKQIKLGKHKLKHVKEVAKLESVRTSSMYQELRRMKLDLAQVYQRLDVMDKCLQSPGGDFVEKSEDMVSFQMLKRKEKLRNLTSSQTYLQDDEQLLTGNCMDDEQLLTAINSRAASFSDRLSVGMSTPGEDNLNGLLTISDLSAAVVSERSLNKNMGFVSENNNVRSPLPTDAGTEVSARSRKRKSISDAVDSIELSCSGINKLFMHVEDNISILRGMANRRSKSSKGGKLTQSYSQAKHDGSRKKRKLHDMNVAMPKQMEKLDIAVQGDADDPTNGAKVHLFDSVSTDANLKDVVDGDYMKLLDLDHADDEKSYRMAMEVPLSPNLPNVNTDNSGPIVDESGYSNGKKSFTSSGNFDIIDMEFDYNMLRHSKPEIVMSILLKELIAQSGIMVNSSDLTVLLHEDKFGQISGCEDVSCVLKMYYDASQSGSCAKNTMCHLTDVLSWVELLASKMNWKWVCNETIRPLLRMLDSSPLTEDLTLSIIILLGQLGRLGVDAVGYEDREMDKLRSQLSAFLWRDSTIRAGLPTQIATLSAILGLIPLDIENVIKQEAPSDITTRRSSPVDLLRNWFHSLSEEEQALSISLLKFPNEEKVLS